MGTHSLRPSLSGTARHSVAPVVWRAVAVIAAGLVAYVIWRAWQNPDFVLEFGAYMLC